MIDYLGQIILFAGDFNIRNYFPCHGQHLPISSYSALFSLIGTTYGGDGRTTFALPDLRGRIAMGALPNNASYSIGHKGGYNNYELDSDNMPPIPFMVSSAEADQSVATAGASIGSPGKDDNGTFSPILGYNTATPNVKIASGGGKGAKVNNMQPYTQMEYLICVSGTYIQ